MAHRKSQSGTNSVIFSISTQRQPMMVARSSHASIHKGGMLECTRQESHGTEAACQMLLSGAILYLK
jgi:hypothetical protein